MGKFAVILVLACVVVQACCLSFKEFTTISKKQKEQLDQLSSKVSSKLPHKYMTEPIYLLRFLRDSDFDVPSAERRILSFMEWRKKNQIDKVLLEEYPEYDEEYRVSWEGCDKGGNPVISLPVGDWDVRKVLVSGKRKRFVRYVQKAIEEGVGLLRWAQLEGVNMTQATILFDLKGISLTTHACGNCISMYLELLGFAQTYYSGFVNKIHVLYAPDFALPLWDIYKHLLSPSLTKLLDIHGSQKSVFAKELSKEIDLSQISRRYGGYKEEGVDFSTWRATAPHNFLANPVIINLKGRNITDYCAVEWPQIVKIIDDAFPELKKSRKET